MIIIPEIETVVILVPRTGTGTLRRAIAEKYPRSMLIYRHMEADGVPLGYDHWRRVGVVRDPLARLWSLYKFLRDFGGDHDPAYIRSMHQSVDRPFDDWLVNNRVPFTTPYDSAGRGRYWPTYTVRHPLPENRKSQRVYLRPDLGTHIVPYTQLEQLGALLDIDLALAPIHNATEIRPMPDISPAARGYLETWFAWDMEAAHG